MNDNQQRDLLQRRTITIKLEKLSEQENPLIPWKICYKRIRRWLQDNRCRIIVKNSGESYFYLQDGNIVGPEKFGNIALGKIEILPAVSAVDKKQAAELFCWVKRGFFEWAYWQYDGQFCMTDYAHEGEKDHEIQQHSQCVNDELDQLLKSLTKS